MVRKLSGLRTIASCLLATSIAFAPVTFAEDSPQPRALTNDELPVSSLRGEKEKPKEVQPDKEMLSKKERKQREKEEKEQQKEGEEKEKEAKKKQKEEATPLNSKAPGGGAAAAGTVQKPGQGTPSTTDAVKNEIPQPDSALVSVLKDLARALKNPEDVAAGDDVNRKAVINAAQQILEKAAQKPSTVPDRIVSNPQTDADALKCVAWTSGDVLAADGLKGSVSAVWAKRENGLLNVHITGESSQTVAEGKTIGQFVVIIKGKTSIQKGFDIQSQSDVSFWLAKPGNIDVESQYCTAVKEEALGNSGVPIVYPVGQAPGQAPDKSEAVASVSAKLQPAASPGSAWESPNQQETTRPPSAGATILIPERAIAGQLLTASVINGDGITEPMVLVSFNGTTTPSDKKGRVSFMVPEDATPGPSVNATFVQNPDLPPSVVNVLQPLSLPSQPEAPRVDRVTPVVGFKRMLTVNGHNFDGDIEHDRVLIDGSAETKLLAASAVQLKVQVPETVQPGAHKLCVAVAGMQSNPVSFQFAAAQVRPFAREARKGQLTKLIILVKGTNEKVQLHITNRTPNAIRLARGNDMHVTTPGGDHNSVVIGVQRLRPGAYQVEARVE